MFGNSYTKPDVILSKAAVMVGDRDFKVLPIGFYRGLIQEAFERLALATYFAEKRENITLDGGIVYQLPSDCFDVKNVYIFTGDICNIEKSHKVYWKRNYYTQGNGFLANDKGGRNTQDPFYDDSLRGSKQYGTGLFARDDKDVRNELYYNFQMGNIMISSSCLGMGQKLHIHYHSTGCAIEEAPIIPTFLRAAMQDFVIVEALLAIMANSSDPRRWQSLWQIHDRKLNAPYTGSWENAEYMAKTLNSSQREELIQYLGRVASASGF